MSKKTIISHSFEFNIILTKTQDSRLFTSNSIGVDGRLLKALVNKRIISLVGRDKKRKVNIYKISERQIKNIRDAFEAMYGENRYTNI